VQNYCYNFQRMHYLPGGDLVEIIFQVANNLFEHQLDEVFNKSPALELRMFDFGSLSYPEQYKLAKILLDKVIFNKK
jgi:hypothetical protein